MRYSRKRLLIKLAVIVFSMACIFASVLRCARLIREHFLEQLEQNLEDVACEDAIAISRQLSFQYDLLNGIEKQLLQMPGKPEDNLKSLQPVVEQYNMVRIGFCSPDGTTHSTDGAVANLSYREFFQNGMRGISMISEVSQDAMNEEGEMVTIFSAPMKNDEGKIIGVFCMTYSTDDINRHLPISSFGGHGYSCVLNDKKRIMVSSDTKALGLMKSFPDEILARNPHNLKVRNELEQRFEAKREGTGQFYLGDEECYFYCSPISVMDGENNWFIVTMVPKDYLQSRFALVERNLRRMIILVCMIVAAGILAFRFFTKEQRKKELQMAYESPVTGGPNWFRFSGVLSGRRFKKGYFICMDITNFSYVRLSVGKVLHREFVREVWKVIMGSLEDHELACHENEDRFFLFFFGDDDTRLVERLQEIHDKVRDVALERHIPWVRPGFGVYRMTNEDSVEDVHDKAKTAREVARKSAEMFYAFYDEAYQVKTVEEQQLEEQFEEALKAERFEVWFQPKFDTHTEMMVGSEALVRWRGEDGRMISPGKFIPLLERTGKISLLDEYVFRKVCIAQKTWKEAGYNICPVSVNVSRASLYHNGILENYCSMIRQNGLEPQAIQMEITETAVVGNDDIADLIRSFREFGIKILMDDFGTGYSSLATLNLQCFDTLKLDKSLVDNIGDPYSETLFYHVTLLGRELGLYITAEGVETKQQLDFLKTTECDDIQGYIFSRPLPMQEYEELLKNRNN